MAQRRGDGGRAAFAEESHAGTSQVGYDTDCRRFFIPSPVEDRVAAKSRWTVTVFRNSLEYAAIAAGGKARTRRTRMSVLDHPTARQLLREARIPTTALAGWPRRLEAFLQRYLPCFYRQEQRELATVVLA